METNRSQRRGRGNGLAGDGEGEQGNGVISKFLFLQNVVFVLQICFLFVYQSRGINKHAGGCAACPSAWPVIVGEGESDVVGDSSAKLTIV